MDAPKEKALVSPGSMLNSSEGILSTAGLAALTTALNTGDDYRVQMAAAIGIAVLASVYVFSRAMTKKGGGDAA
tara:strand:- start:2102 stop:2323 length:222 start_codon:yes stop_codon:yes gene_type:complete